MVWTPILVAVLVLCVLLAIWGGTHLWRQWSRWLHLAHESGEVPFVQLDLPYALRLGPQDRLCLGYLHDILGFADSLHSAAAAAQSHDTAHIFHTPEHPNLAQLVERRGLPMLIFRGSLDVLELNRSTPHSNGDIAALPFRCLGPLWAQSSVLLERAQAPLSGEQGRVQAQLLHLFERILPQVLAALPTSGPVVLGGHSLGGALACLTAAALVHSHTVILVGSGTPKPGDAAFRSYLERHCKHVLFLVNEGDVVPFTPTSVVPVNENTSIYAMPPHSIFFAHYGDTLADNHDVRLYRHATARLLRLPLAYNGWTRRECTSTAALSHHDAAPSHPPGAAPNL